MTKAEMALLLAKCAAYDSRTIGDADVLAWHEAMGDLHGPDAMAAVVAWYREHRERIMPSDIRRAVREIRAERHKHGPSDAELTADVDPHDIPAYLRVLAERRRLVGDGAVILAELGERAGRGSVRVIEGGSR